MSFSFEALKSTKISSYEPVSSQKYENGHRTEICNFTVSFVISSSLRNLRKFCFTVVDTNPQWYHIRSWFNDTQWEYTVTVYCWLLWLTMRPSVLLLVSRWTFNHLPAAVTLPTTNLHGRDAFLQSHTLYLVRKKDEESCNQQSCSYSSCHGHSAWTADFPTLGLGCVVTVYMSLPASVCPLSLSFFFRQKNRVSDGGFPPGPSSWCKDGLTAWL